MTQQFIFSEFLARSSDTDMESLTLMKVLRGLPPLGSGGPWLAGGALRRTLLGQEPDSDFDFFFQDADQLAEFRSAIEATATFIRETEHHVHFRTNDAIPRDIQMIRFAFYPSMGAVIDSFDFTICQFAFDGVAIMAGEHSLWDLGRRRLAVNKVTFPVSTMRRVLKYASQGFTACNGCLTAILRETRDNPSLDLQTAYVD